jgi:hypothetical protein
LIGIGADFITAIAFGLSRPNELVSKARLSLAKYREFFYISP